MSLKVRTFKVSKLNKCLEIIFVIAISAVLVSLKLSYGQEYNMTDKAEMIKQVITWKKFIP